MAASKQQNKKPKETRLSRSSQEEMIRQIMKDNPDMTKQEAVSALRGLDDIKNGRVHRFKTVEELDKYVKNMPNEKD